MLEELFMKYKLEFTHKDKDFEDVWYIEKEYFEPSTIASVTQAIEWDRENPDSSIFVRDNETDKIIGEITLLPLTKKQFEKFMINELQDVEINNDTILKYENNLECYLLFSAIAIHNDYREDRRVLSLLLKGLYEKIHSLLNRNIKFLNMCSEGQTLDGQRFIESFLNLKHRYTTKKGYKLYSFDNKEEFDVWFEIFPKYILEYNEKFDLN